MRKIRLLAALMVIFSMFMMVSGAAAQGSYSFQMNREVVNVSWNQDGTEEVDYVFSFINDPNGHPIDFVDVGMPNGNYSQVSADANGSSLNISSDYQGQGGYGCAVEMGSQTIQPGQSGTLHVHVGKITGVLYNDSQDPNTHASGVFSPTWFGSQYVHGDTDLSVIFHLPPGVLPEEPAYHTVQGGWPCASDPQKTFDSNNRITYTWQCPNANGSTQYTFGASFPKKYVPSDAIVVPPAVNINIGNAVSGLGGFL